MLYRPRNSAQTDGQTDGRTDDITISVEPIFLKMYSKKSKFAEFSRVTTILHQLTTETENFIQIGALLETRFAKIAHFLRILYLHEMIF
jgi:hypothetical protein